MDRRFFMRPIILVLILILFLLTEDWPGRVVADMGGFVVRV
jgi:hypothetical protein